MKLTVNALLFSIIPVFIGEKREVSVAALELTHITDCVLTVSRNFIRYYYNWIYFIYPADYRRCNQWIATSYLNH